MLRVQTPASLEAWGAAFRAAQERTASCRRFSGPRTPSLGPEKRLGNFGRKFANFVLGEGEAPRRAGPATGRYGRGGPPARPAHSELAGLPKEGREAGRRRAPRFPKPPCRPRNGPPPPEMARAPGSPSSRDAQQHPELPGLETWPSTRVIFLFTSPGSSFPPDSSSFTPFPSFVFSSICLFHFVYIRLLGH